MEVDVGGGDDSDVDGGDARAAKADDFAFLEYSEQAGLEGFWHVADFVDEDGAAAGDFKVAGFAVAQCACEGAALVAKEF